MPTLEFQSPTTIDGDPSEVETVVKNQLRDAGLAAAELIRTSGVQLRSSRLSELLKGQPRLSADELRELADQDAGCQRAERLIAAGRSIGEEIRSL